ncbi:histidine kinase [Streptomyces sp. NPDC005955]|uniref:sensor histidine kinase n=1 Tax=Streptomyces sp. NPDC005955 TaxID=3364738 RepID=UPI00368199A3
MFRAALATAPKALFGGRARRRWTHLVLGGALAMPFLLAGSVLLALLGVGGGTGLLGTPRDQVLSLAVGLSCVPLVALFPVARPVAVAAVRALRVTGAGDALGDGPARSWGARGRTSAWFALHLVLGVVISGATLAVVPLGLALLVLPPVTALRGEPLGDSHPAFSGGEYVLTPFAGLAALVALAACAAVAGAVLARAVPVLLGPGPADRLAAAERRAADLAVRNRLARELHDSVGHALSAVGLQAAAARRLLDRDPEFVRTALVAIEETTRRTVGELDAVLGVLRDDDAGAPTAPAPTLATDLDGLLRRTRATGLRVETALDPGPHGLAALPPQVSREAYRIVQEALGNALRHAGTGTPVGLRVTVTATELEITAENPLPAAPRPAPRTGGGQGLPGIADRVRLLGGTVAAGAHDGRWSLCVRLPLRDGA